MTASRLCSIALALGATAFAPSALGQPFIVHVQPGLGIPVYLAAFQVNPTLEIPLDIDQDGISDYLFSGEGVSVLVRPAANQAQLAELATGRDMGSTLIGLTEGTLIGDPPIGGIEWVDSSTPNHAVPGQSVFAGCADIGPGFPACFGDFNYRIAFMGLRLQASDGTHYGWVRIDASIPIGGGVIRDWAYETRPNTPILAGAVPEPSVGALLALGAALMWRLRRRASIQCSV